MLIYRERGVHADPQFNENGTITSTPKYPLEWIPELSNGSEDDILVLPNVALLVSVISNCHDNDYVISFYEMLAFIFSNADSLIHNHCLTKMNY